MRISLGRYNKNLEHTGWSRRGIADEENDWYSGRRDDCQNQKLSEQRDMSIGDSRRICDADRMTGSTDKRSKQLADCATYRIGCTGWCERKVEWRREMFRPIAISMVAVVRPLRSNHFSEYMGPRTWKAGCAIAENIFGVKDVSVIGRQ